METETEPPAGVLGGSEHSVQAEATSLPPATDPAPPLPTTPSTTTPPATPPPAAATPAPRPFLSTPLLVLLWLLIHALVVLELPDCPISPGVARFLSGQLWYRLQGRLALAPRPLGMARTHETMRWPTTGAVGNFKHRARWTRDSLLARPLEVARYLAWMGVMQWWTTRGEVLRLGRGPLSHAARAVGVPLPALAMAHLHSVDIQNAVGMLLLTALWRLVVREAMPRAEVVAAGLRGGAVGAMRPVVLETI